MIYTLAKPIRRTLALLLLATAIGAIAFLVVGPVVSQVLDVQERIQQERIIIGRLNAALSDNGQAQEARQRNSLARIQGLFVQGESEAIRVASIQSQLMEILGVHQVKPRSVRNLPTREQSNLRLAGIQLQIAAPIDRLQAVLMDIESHRPLFLIETLQITAPALAIGTDSEDRNNLEVRLDVFGVEAQQKLQ